MIIICMLFAFVTTAQPFVMMQIVIWELCKDSVRKRISHSTLRQAVFAQSLNGIGTRTLTISYFTLVFCLHMSGSYVRIV